MVIISEKILKKLSTDILVAAGTCIEEAIWVSDCLVLSNLKGVDSHGVQQLPGYVKAIEDGFLRPGSDIKLVKEKTATSFFDGGWGYGYTVARHVMKLTMEKAKRSGIAFSVIRNIHHIGRVGKWAEMALEENLIGIASQPGGVYLAPWGGLDRKLPIAPIAFSVPASKYPSIIIDMSLGPIAGGRTSILAIRNKKVPNGWYIDDDGENCNDPKLFNAGKGAQLPLGQSGLGYKGMALSMMIEILAGPLLGLISEPGMHAFKRRGVFLGAIEIEAFIKIENFKDCVDRMIDDIKSSRLATGFDEILVPGEPEWREMKRRKKEGIFLDDVIFDKIIETAETLGIEKSDYELVSGDFEIKHPSYTLKYKYKNKNDG